ncbi:MAG: 30S ribosomal protein S5 [Patescibacteria group bacterium]|nr:30S ribosomal protein S5 [Patescibacteria group bacterium]MDD5715358.1 30S ribosomal protein S5 [Patescibacteria group bacterium]
MAEERRTRNRDNRHERKDDEFGQKLIDIARVTRVMAGGKRMSFRACVVIGDRKGHVGMGLKKGADVAVAINKAVVAAKKSLVAVHMVDDTIPARIVVKFKAARVLLKPARKGTGVIAGGAIRAVLDLAGVKNVVAKILGSKSKINNVRAALLALERLKDPRQLREMRK